MQELQQFQAHLIQERDTFRANYQAHTI